MDRKHREALEAHLLRYGIPLPADKSFGMPRIAVGRKVEQITRELNETEQESLFWQTRSILERKVG